MKNLISVIILGCLVLNTLIYKANSQTLEWLQQGVGLNNISYGISVDDIGNSYITGVFIDTVSFNTDTIISVGEEDVFVAKYNTFGVLQWLKSFGGLGFDRGFAIKVSNNGELYVTGSTSSSTFPTTIGVYDSTFNGNNDVFVLKLNSNDGTIIYSTFIGETSQDIGWGITVDSAENVFLLGTTQSSNFPTTPGSYDVNYNGGQTDLFVCKLSADGSSLIYSTFIGGSDGEFGTHGIKVNSNGEVVIVSGTYSVNFPTTPGAYQNINIGNADVIFCRLNNTGSDLLNSTYIGGFTYESGFGIDLLSSEEVVITGETQSGDFPITSNAYDSSLDGQDVFIIIYNYILDSLVYSTFLGGNLSDGGSDIRINNNGEVILVGETNSSDFPITANAYDSLYSGNEAFITKLDMSSNTVKYSSYLGLSSSLRGFTVDLNDDSTIYISGVINDDAFTAKFSDSNNNNAIDDWETVKKLIRVYPNPFSSSAVIQLAGGNCNKECSFVMYDVLGREVREFKVESLPAGKAGLKFKVGRGSLRSGMYFYKITANNETIGMGKLVVED